MQESMLIIDSSVKTLGSANDLFMKQELNFKEENPSPLLENCSKCGPELTMGYLQFKA